MKNVLIVLSGPSGVGKGTIAKLLVERNENLSLSISCTTRKPRDGEIDGKEYFFLDKSEFERMIEDNGFLEYSNHFENYYGTPRDFVMENLKEHDVLLEIDVNGGLNVRESFPEAVLIMTAPPSKEEVRKRLINRHTESPDKIDLRINRMEYELGKSELYDYVVVNDELNRAVEEIEEIIIKEKNK